MFYNFYYHMIEKGTIWAFIIALAENLLVEQHIEQAKSSCLSAYFLFQIIIFPFLSIIITKKKIFQSLFKSIGSVYRSSDTHNLSLESWITFAFFLTF